MVNIYQGFNLIMALSPDAINYALMKIIQTLSGYRVRSRPPEKDFVLMDIGDIKEINSNYVTMVLISPDVDLVNDFIENARAWLNIKGLSTVKRKK
jgi:hypothetical protein